MIKKTNHKNVLVKYKGMYVLTTKIEAKKIGAKLVEDEKKPPKKRKPKYSKEEVKELIKKLEYGAIESFLLYEDRPDYLSLTLVELWNKFVDGEISYSPIYLSDDEFYNMFFDGKKPIEIIDTITRSYTIHTDDPFVIIEKEGTLRTFVNVGEAIEWQEGSDTLLADYLYYHFDEAYKALGDDLLHLFDCYDEKLYDEEEDEE